MTSALEATLPPGTLEDKDELIKWIANALSTAHGVKVEALERRGGAYHGLVTLESGHKDKVHSFRKGPTIPFTNVEMPLGRPSTLLRLHHCPKECSNGNGRYFELVNRRAVPDDVLSRLINAGYHVKDY